MHYIEKLYAYSKIAQLNILYFILLLMDLALEVSLKISSQRTPNTIQNEIK